MLLYVCSTNMGKLRDFALAAEYSEHQHCEIKPLPNLHSHKPPEETGETFEENAALKAAYYSTFTGEFVLADDSGLEVDGLGGEPGIYSARYAGEGATDAENDALLLQRLEHVLNRHARFVCTVALAQAGRVLTTVRGTVQGEILEAPQGENGFGYDPLFFYSPLGCTFAQLTPAEKFAVSHRGHAMRLFFKWLVDNPKQREQARTNLP